MKKELKDIVIQILSYKYKRQGFSTIAAEEMVLEHLMERFKGGYKRDVLRIAKKHGFLPSTVLALGITEENYQDYLSDDDYFRLTPLDGRYHSWIDNKLTLKYLLGELSSCMPLYYFQILSDGRVLKLFECPDRYKDSEEGILHLLYDVKKLGLKREFGALGEGFYKAVCDDKGNIFVNDKRYTEPEFLAFIRNLREYLVIEYLESAGIPAEIYPKTVNSIRVIIGIEDRRQYMLGSFIKFGEKNSGYVDNLSGGGIACPIDQEGCFCGGYTKLNGVLIDIEEHPDTHKKLCGRLEQWEEINQLAQKILMKLPQLTYCGFDFVISDKGVKLLEINDRSGFLTIQKYSPLLKNKTDNFYLKRLDKIKRGYRN